MRSGRSSTELSAHVAAEIAQPKVTSSATGQNGVRHRELNPGLTNYGGARTAPRGNGAAGRAKSYIGAMPSRRFCRCRIRLRLRLLSSCFLRVAARAYGTTPLGGLPHLPAATFRDPTETLGALLKNRCASSGSPRSYPSGHGAGPEIQWALPAQVRTLPIAFYNDRVFLQRLGMSARGPDRAYFKS